MGHCYFAFNRLWYDDLTGWAVDICGFDKTVKRDTEDMSYFSHFDRFYTPLTLSIMIVFFWSIRLDYASRPNAGCGDV